MCVSPAIYGIATPALARASLDTLLRRFEGRYQSLDDPSPPLALLPLAPHPDPSSGCL
jgi:hypothetical protein